MIKTNSLTKTKRGSLGSLSSLNERNDLLEADGISSKKSSSSSSFHASKSLEMDLDEISKDGKNENCNSDKRSFPLKTF